MLNNEKKNFLQVFAESVQKTKDPKLAKVLQSKSPEEWLLISLNYANGISEVDVTSLDDQVTIAIVAVLYNRELIYAPQSRIEVIEDFNRSFFDKSFNRFSNYIISFAQQLTFENFTSLGIDFTVNNNSKKRSDEGDADGANRIAMPAFAYFMQKHNKFSLDLPYLIEKMVSNCDNLIQSFVDKIKQLEDELQDLRLKVARYEEDKRRSIPKGVAKVVTFNGILHFIESCNSVEEAKPYEAMLYKLMRSGNVEEKDYERIDEAMAKVRARENRFGNNFYAPVTNNGTINGDVKNNKDKKNEQ